MTGALFASAKSQLERVKNYEPGKPIEELERQYGVRRAIKMASNENPLGPSPMALAAVKRALTRVHRYPDGGCHVLRQKLAKRLGVGPAQLVFGNGSDELLVFAARALAGPGDEIVIADPTFLIYEIAGTAEGARVVRVPVKQFRYDLEGMLRAVTERTKIIFIANPDNPVGTYIPRVRLEPFLRRVPSDVVVVLDEAYHEFAVSHPDYPDSVRLLSEYGNLLVTRTFSKAYGLAGLRVGYGVGRPDLVRTLDKVREPFNVNLLAQEAAVAALDDRRHLERSVRLVRKGGQYLREQAARLGLETVETATNFVLIDLKRPAREIYEKLLRKGVIVRPMTAWGFPEHIRVTVGTDAENHRFVRTLKKILKKQSKRHS